MLNVKDDKCKKKSVESMIVKALKEKDYSLNIVNRYGENMMHVAATNDCTDIINCVLERNDIRSLERKNAYGWTPLMQAVRNRNIKTVEILLNNEVIVNDFSYLGISVLSLAAATSTEVFDLVCKACPTALEYASCDDINPLCIAALKNDKELFFKLVNMGLDVSKANAITNIMMKRSSVPEIAELAKSHQEAEEYWKSCTELIETSDEDEFAEIQSSNVDIKVKQMYNYKRTNEIKEPLIKIQNQRPKLNRANAPKSIDLSGVIKNWLEPNTDIKNLISPKLMYINESVIPASPNTCFIKADDLPSPVSTFRMDVDDKPKKKFCKNNISFYSPEYYQNSDLPVLQRCQDYRPADLNLENNKCDLNESLGFTPHYSPSKSPNVPASVGEEDNLHDDLTPTPPKYGSPPRGIILSPRETKLVLLLQKYELSHHIPIFLEQEVDIGLFLTLTLQDLKEIGINSKAAQEAILHVIEENRSKFILPETK